MPSVLNRLFVIVMVLMFVHVEYAQNEPDLDAVLRSMTLEQKVGQMFMVGLWGPNITEDGERFLQTYQPGGIVVFAYNVGTAASVTQLINDWQTTITEAGAPPMLVAIDQEGGRINTLEEEPFTQFPAPVLVTAASNYNLAYAMGQAQARELLAIGINMNLAPVADLETNPDNPVIFRRSYGSDPTLVAPTIAAVVQGMQDAGVAATLKHFPGHGDTDEDSHLGLPVIPYSREALETMELVPFQSGIDAGVEAVMVGHLQLPAIDPTPDLPASLSYPIVTGILREDMGFDGVIMTDAMDMDAIDTRYGLPQASVMAIQSGVDLIATGPHVGMQSTENAIAAVIEAVRAGTIPESQIDASVRRILDVKFRYGVMVWQPLDLDTAEERVRAVESDTIIQQVFDAGATVVYDREGLLPLDGQRRIGLAYPFHRMDVLRECENAYPDMQLVGFSNFPDGEQIRNVAQLADTVDVMIIFTQNAITKPEQVKLVDALPADKLVIVAYWSPYDVTAFAHYPAAYLTTYSPLTMGISSACRIIFGQLPAHGRLPLHLSGDLANIEQTNAVTR